MEDTLVWISSSRFQVLEFAVSDLLVAGRSTQLEWCLPDYGRFPARTYWLFIGYAYIVVMYFAAHIGRFSEQFTDLQISSFILSFELLGSFGSIRFK